MMSGRALGPITFTPPLASADGYANYWMRQVVLRLRREICWRWSAAASPGPTNAGGRLIDSLDHTRHWEAKQAFFATDPTARFLSQPLDEPPPDTTAAPRGSLGWVAQELALEPAALFTLALALVSAFDGAAGPVVAACLNDATRTHPTLGLAQQLWDRPDAVLALADPGHALWRLGLLQGGAATLGGAMEWEYPIGVAPLVAQQLLSTDAPLPRVLTSLGASEIGDATPELPSALTARLLAAAPGALRVIAVLGAEGAAHREWATAISARLGCTACECRVDAAGDAGAALRPLLTLAWLRGVAVLVRDDAAERGGGEGRNAYGYLAALRSIPATVFVIAAGAAELSALPKSLVAATFSVPRLGYHERVACWRQSLGRRAADFEDEIAECARRFRFERATVQELGAALRQQAAAPTASGLRDACRAAVRLDAGELAQEVVPRFDDADLVLPPAQHRQIDEIARAMGALTEVHYTWGTGRAWGDSGLSVLFCGPPGTGKTMAAEILAARLDMPMYRIDLSQVVNKYIGETEKNLKRLFDLADVADAILFFDECDALFGRRTEVRDAHDRYANLEVSYLLERMERFKGLAILATNRRKDLDDAFLRRLRYVVEFPMPDAVQRSAIWRRVMPLHVDASAIDFEFLGRQFPLTGGHIRSSVLNACLQTAGRAAGTPRLAMEDLVVAIKREYDKLNRSASAEQFGRYAPLIEGLVHG